jgi:nicotinate-nucleotide adenylyltransferase
MNQPIGRGPRVAFFGGSFDPPHLGHLAVARAARAALNLDSVLFAPVGAQPLKPQGSTARFADRLAMTRLAIGTEEGFAVSLADAPNPSDAPNYTLETLLRLRAELPQEGVLFCLMGADSFAGLRGWHRGAEIPFVTPLVVASRPGERLDDLRAALPEGLGVGPVLEAEGRQPDVSQPASSGEVEMRRYLLSNRAGEEAPFYLLPGLEVGISASAIRQQVRAASGSQTPVDAVLPEAVSAYIRAHGLYR